MEMVEKHKLLYKFEILFLKLIPMMIALCFFLNTVLSFFGIETEVLSYIASVGLLPLAFLYLSSYVFRFCAYHRMFLHYILVGNLICLYDDKYGIPVDYISYFVIHVALAAIVLFIILYLKFKVCKH